MSEFDTSQLSPRMQRLLEKNGGVIPGVGQVETPPKQADTEVTQPRGTVQENKEAKEKKEKIAADLELVLGVVPKEVRSETTKYLEYREKTSEAAERLKEAGIDTDAYTREGVNVGSEEGNVEFGKRKKELREIVQKMRNKIELSDDEKKVMEKVNVKKEELAEEKKATEPKTEEIKQEEPQVFKHQWEEQIVLIDHIPESAFRQEALKQWILANLSDPKIPYVFKETQLKKIGPETALTSEAKLPDVLKGITGNEKGRKKYDDVSANLEIGRINDFEDPGFRYSALVKLRQNAYQDGVSKDLIDEINRLANEAQLQKRKEDLKKGAENVTGIPKIKEGEPGYEEAWRKYVRRKMTVLLDPSKKESRNANNVFGEIIIDPLTNEKRQIDASPWIPDSMRDDLIFGIKDGEDNIVAESELEISQKIGKIYNIWRPAHTKIGDMVTAIEGKEYVLPDNDLNKRFFNGLRSEDGRDPEGGSKNIAKALQIYWAMAHSKEAEGKTILRRNHLESVTNMNIFDSQLNLEEIGKIRGKIAAECGGAYYENVGLMYAGFYGISAYGSDSTKPRIPYADAMGVLVHSEENKFKDIEEKKDVNRSNARYLDDTIANRFNEVKDGRFVKINGKEVPIELGAHSGNLQTQVEVKNEPRGFYVIRPINSQERYRIVKKISVPDAEGNIYGTEVTPGTFALDRNNYEEVLFDNLIKEGRINEIDWGRSENVSAIMRSREKGAIEVYKMYKNLDDDMTKLNAKVLVQRRDNFESAMPQYNIETQQYAMYLWLHSLINKNDSWTASDKKESLVIMLKDAREAKLISNGYYSKLVGAFSVGFLGDAAGLVNGSYRGIGGLFKPRS